MSVLGSLLHSKSLLNNHLKFILPACWHFTTANTNVDLSILRTYHISLICFCFCWIYPHLQDMVVCFVFKDRLFCSFSQQLHIWNCDSGFLLFLSYSNVTVVNHAGCCWCVVYQYSCLLMELCRCYNLNGNYRFV
jgi:hypothetical protein